MKKYCIWRPAFGISLNAGHREYLQDENGKVLMFDTEPEAVSFLKKKGLDDEFINAVNIEQEKI